MIKSRYISWCSSLSVASTASIAIEAMKLMSFNIRYDNPRDGPNQWCHRKLSTFETIRNYAPDIVALQEVLPSQLADLRTAFPDYSVASFGRDGPDEGEAVVIMSLEAPIETGGFWLSPTPKVCSVGWDAELPRVCIWTRFSDGLVVIATHFDHLGPTSRAESAKQIKAWLGTETNAIVMGDFNAAPSGSAYQVFTEPPDPQLIDTYRALHAREPGGTFHDFGAMFVHDRIDWIFCTAQWRVTAARVDRSKPQGIWPSDHYPVTADLERAHIETGPPISA